MLWLSIIEERKFTMQHYDFGVLDTHRQIVALLREEIKRLQIQLAIEQEKNKELTLKLERGGS